MYKKETEGWLKHYDFILLDMLCIQIAFILSYIVCGYGFHPYENLLYRSMAIFFELADVIVIFSTDTFKGVIRRGYYKGFVIAVRQGLLVGALAILYLFLIQEGENYSRAVLVLTILFYILFSYTIRQLWKGTLKKQMIEGKDRSLLIITTKGEAESVIESMKKNNYARYVLAGVAIIDCDMTGSKIGDLEVVANGETAPMYVCQEWIDEVLVVASGGVPYPKELIEQLTETGVTIHFNLTKISNELGKKQFVEKIGNYTVLTTSINYASAKELLLKRIMDICAGLVGCILTGLVFLFVAPAIYISSPGPIFFSQERVGQNGKKFKMYKFRSMYMDAEERKAELMKENWEMEKCLNWILIPGLLEIRFCQMVQRKQVWEILSEKQVLMNFRSFSMC